MVEWCFHAFEYLRNLGGGARDRSEAEQQWLILLQVAYAAGTGYSYTDNGRLMDGPQDVALEWAVPPPPVLSPLAEVGLVPAVPPVSHDRRATMSWHAVAAGQTTERSHARGLSAQRRLAPTTSGARSDTVALFA